MKQAALRAHVIYRATTMTGRTVEMRLVMNEAQATVADAWRRLSSACPGVDPATLEIETRSLPARLQMAGGAARAGADSVVVALAEMARA